ncbi:hypothetical protein [Cohnella hongkongensis]|uniref:Uncharacterized protein n=1 Tax=Cohnella hongkongensis TaxID=178337 RepID=A0ABV9FEN0_9BACL
MRKRTRSDEDLKSMSEYGSNWFSLIMLQVGFIGFFWLYLFLLRIGNLSLVNELQYLHPLKLTEDPWRSFGIAVLVLYFYVVMSALNMLLFKTIDVRPILKQFKMFKSRDLGIWFLSFLSFLGWAKLSEVLDETKIVYAVVATIIMLCSSFFFCRYIIKLKGYYKFLAILILAGTFIYYITIEIRDNRLGSDFDVLFSILKSLAWVLFAQFVIIYVLVLFSMLISSAINEYRSAQLGKESQFRKLMMESLGDLFNKQHRRLNSNLTGKPFSRQMLQDLFKEIFNLKGLAFYERLTLIKKIVQTDVSLKFPAVKAKYLQFRNKLNLYVSIVFLLNIIVIVLFVLPYLDRKSDALLILLIMMATRLFQRTIEIGWAFYQDITSEKPKSSTLTGSNRLILAVKSIIEMMITSALFYFLFDSLGKLEAVKKPFQEGYAEYVWMTLVKMAETSVGSVAVSFFNVSLPLDSDNPFTFRTIIHIVQVGISIILITLSIANYLNMKKNAYQYSVIREEDRYVAYYYLQLPGEEPIKREIARGTSKVELKEKVKAMWQEQKIEDAEFASVIACLDNEKNELESGKAEIEKLRDMNYQQLDGYVRQMLKDHPHKSNKSIRLIEAKGETDRRKPGFGSL